ncbi:MAG: RraA family protein [Mangrovicoccus sp.]
MLQKPHLLRIKRPNRRPSEAQIKAFEGMPASFVSDAMGGAGALDTAIAPPSNAVSASVVGVALTVENTPGDLQATLAGLHFLQPGDIFMVNAGGYLGCSASGDLVTGMAKNAGALGFVIDGPMRDIAGIEAVGLPVWCMGLNPSSPTVQGPGKIGYPTLIGGQPVETGDIIVADRDGVVVVPFAQIDAVIAVLPKVKADEEEMEAKVAEGLKGFDTVAALLKSDQVAYED